MNRFKATLAIAVVSLFALTACGGDATKVTEGAKDAVENTAKTAAEGATKAGEGAMKAGDAAKDAMGGMAAKAGGVMSLVALKDSIPGLKDGATAAIAAVKAGDFKGAQAEVTKLQESWGKVSEMVKTHSGGSYDKISSTLKTVQTELKAPSPDKTKILADLTSLSSSVSGLASIK